MSENRPLLVKDYAKSWRATEYWSDKTYLAEQAANMVHLSSFGMRHGRKEEIKKEENKKEFEKGSIKDLFADEKAAQEEADKKAVQEETDKKASPGKNNWGAFGRTKDGKWSEHLQKPHEKTMTIEQALDKIQKNDPEADNMSFLSFEQFKAPRMRKDYEYPVLHDFLPFKFLYLSIWPQFEHKPKQLEGESWHCVLDGREKIRLMSPVFSQNLYQGVYEHYEPQALPNELDLFNVDEEKFPLLHEV